MRRRKMIIFKGILSRRIEIVEVSLEMQLLMTMVKTSIEIIRHRMSLMDQGKLIITTKIVSHKSLQSGKTKDSVSLSTLLIYSMRTLSLRLMDKDKLDLYVEDCAV